jgi:sortase A
VLPPVAGAPRVQDRTEDRGAAGVDEATTFMSQWGPPPLRPTEEAAPGWAGPGAPSRAGAGRPADTPADRQRPADAPAGRQHPTDIPADRQRPAEGPGDRQRPAHGPADRQRPAESPADRQRPAESPADRQRPADVPADRQRPADAGDWPRPAGNPVDRGMAWSGPAAALPPVADAPQERVERAPTEPAAERWIADRLAEDRARAAAGMDPATSFPAGQPQPVEEGFAGYWVRDRPAKAESTAQRPAELTGPLGVGAWNREGTATRPRDRQHPEQPRPDNRVPSGSGAGGGGDEPPNRGGGGGRGGEPERGRRTLGDRIRAFIRGIGQTFITLGLILLLFAGYEVWFTDVLNHRTQKHLTTELQEQWEQTGDDPTVAAPGAPDQKVRSIPLGDAFALIYIPDFGTDYVFSVVQGTGVDELNEGPGHYVDTPLPGAVGNMAIAGHRVGKGSPFLNLDKLKAGSAIVIRTKSYWYTYRVVGDASGNADAVSSLGFPGREIVDPSDVGVIAPVPDKPGAKPSRRVLTLTTCHPKFTARQRMVIHAQMQGAPFPVSRGTPPSMTGA